MLRNDGKYTIFKIQHWIEPGEMYKNGKWAESDLDIFLRGHKAEQEKLCTAFSASGDCWQETGEHGVYDSDTAVDMLKFVTKLNPERRFRVVRVEVHQQTVGVFYYQPEEVKYADLRI